MHITDTTCNAYIFIMRYKPSTTSAASNVPVSIRKTVIQVRRRESTIRPIVKVRPNMPQKKHARSFALQAPMLIKNYSRGGTPPRNATLFLHPCWHQIHKRRKQRSSQHTKGRHSSPKQRVHN